MKEGCERANGKASVLCAVCVGVFVCWLYCCCCPCCLNETTSMTQVNEMGYTRPIAKTDCSLTNWMENFFSFPSLFALGVCSSITVSISFYGMFTSLSLSLSFSLPLSITPLLLFYFISMYSCSIWMFASNFVSRSFMQRIPFFSRRYITIPEIHQIHEWNHFQRVERKAAAMQRFHAESPCNYRMQVS